MHKKLIGLGIAAACGAAMAQSQPTSSPVTEAVRKAIQGNPEVAARYNVFEASVREIDVAAGGFLPKVDAGLTGGARKYANDQFRPYDHELRKGQVDLSISQLLWDGLATRNEVRRLDHARLLRWFEFRDATEQAGLEAAAAYYDVVRFRKLVSLAEDNYVQHKLSYEQVQSRVKAGVGRGVDLEQVVARVALAESNLVTERANLHDVTERYRRVVGDLPASESTTAASLASPLPPTAAEAVETATRRSPAIEASIENLRSARAAAAARKGAYQPTVEARVTGGWGHNYSGELYQKRDATAEIVLSWNLFNGGADMARERQYAALLTQAENLRDKACNDVRQTAAIAFNDVRKLREQLVYLDHNVVSIEKARDAYRQQFDIGQRSLLDLLNAENELYTARRAYAMAEADLATAVMRTYAAMGTLTANLGLSQRDAGEDAAGAEHWSADGDGSARCPVSATDIGGASFDQLDERAKALAASRMLPTPAPAATPAASSAAPAPAPAPAGPTAQQRVSATIATQRLKDWAAAWMAKDYLKYMSFYGDEFKPLKTPRAKWQAERKRLVTKKGTIEVRIENIETRPLTETRVETSFDQVYVSPDFKDTMRKTLVWDRVEGEWRIVGETNR